MGNGKASRKNFSEPWVSSALPRRFGGVRGLGVSRLLALRSFSGGGSLGGRSQESGVRGQGSGVRSQGSGGRG